MSDTISANGSCLCGAIQFTALTVSTHVGACHCGMCRKWGGGPLMVLDCGTEVMFEDDAAISVYPSSDWAERGFCNRCGSHLFYRLTANQQYFMPTGLFPSDLGLVFDHQVFIEEKPAFYEFANRTENLTGEELFAKFAGT